MWIIDRSHADRRLQHNTRMILVLFVVALAWRAPSIIFAPGATNLANIGLLKYVYLGRVDTIVYRLYESAIEWNPKLSQARYGLVLFSSSRGDTMKLDLASSQLEHLDGERRELAAWIVGNACFKAGRYDCAAVSWDKSSFSLRPLIRLAKEFEMNGDFQQSESAWLVLLKIAPDDLYVYESLGDFYWRRGKREKAATVFAKGSRQVLVPGSIYLAARYEEMLGNRIAAGVLYQAAYNAGLHTPSVIFGVADGYLISGKNFEALDVYKYGVKIEPDGQRWYLRIGSIYEKQGDLRSAEFWYRQAVQNVPGTHKYRFWSLLGSLFLRQREYEQADAAYHNALPMLDDDLDVNFGLALTRLVLLGDFDQSEQFFRRTVDLIDASPKREGYLAIAQMISNSSQFATTLDRVIDCIRTNTTCRQELRVLREVLSRP